MSRFLWIESNSFLILVVTLVTASVHSPTTLLSLSRKPIKAFLLDGNLKLILCSALNFFRKSALVLSFFKILGKSAYSSNSLDQTTYRPSLQRWMVSKMILCAFQIIVNMIAVIATLIPKDMLPVTKALKAALIAMFKAYSWLIFTDIYNLMFKIVSDFHC